MNRQKHILVLFVLLATSLVASAQTDKVFTVAAHEPKFPGGIEKLLSTLNKNIHYPSIDTSRNIYSTLIIQFIVEKDGSLSNIHVFKKNYGKLSEQDPTDPLSKEVRKVITALPKWEPATQNGHQVRFLFNMPIHIDFKADE